MSIRNTTFLLLAFLLLPLPGQEPPAPRVVSLSPSLTEVVGALGREECLVGISSFCNWPEQVQHLPRVGGLLDLNVEHILRLQPDLILAQPEHESRLTALPATIRVLLLRQRTLAESRQTIPLVAKALGDEKKGQAVLKKMDLSLQAIRQRTRPPGPKPRILILVSRAGGGLGKPILAGPDTFLSELLELSGGVNACPGPVPYPQMGPEALLQLHPQGVVDISVFENGISRAQRAAWWQNLPFHPPLNAQRLLLEEEDLWVRPGPRMVQIAQKLARFIDQLPTGNGTP